MTRKQTDPFEGYCRNRHKRNRDNTHLRPDGSRQCKECPSWQLRYISSAKRRTVRDDPARTAEMIYHRVLSAAELAYLRSLIPCVCCGATQNSKGVTRHRAGCRVPYNVEDDGTARGPSELSMRAA